MATSDGIFKPAAIERFGKNLVDAASGQRLPEELASRLPPKRKPWMSEHYQMDIFDAVALALVFRLKQAKFQTS